MREQYGVTGIWTASHEYARYAISAGRASVESLDVLHVTVGVLPLGLVVELDMVLGLAAVDRREVVSNWRRKERKLGGDAGRQGWAAEQVHQLAERHPVHCKHIRRGTITETRKRCDGDKNGTKRRKNNRATRVGGGDKSRTKSEFSHRKLERRELLAHLPGYYYDNTTTSTATTTLHRTRTTLSGKTFQNNNIKKKSRTVTSVHHHRHHAVSRLGISLIRIADQAECRRSCCCDYVTEPLINRGLEHNAVREQVNNYNLQKPKTILLRCVIVGVVVVVGAPPVEESASSRFFHDTVVYLVILPRVPA